MAEDIKGNIDISVVPLIEKIDNWIDAAIRSLPNLVVAVIIFLFFYALGITIQRFVTSRLTKRKRKNLGEVLGGFLKFISLVLGFLIAATITFPTLNPGDLVAGLGVGSVAIGFAFKEILQNWLAGLLILFRQPFNIGDQIHVKEYEGTVERIETRATLIRTYDGQRVVIPNSDIYTNPVLVKTAFKLSRSEYDVGIGYNDDLKEACSVIKKVLSKIDAVADDPAPEMLPWALEASWVTIRVRWWTKSMRIDIVECHAQVIEGIKYAFDKAGIDMPFETYVHLFHDQTEAQDKDRRLHREGWPAVGRNAVDQKKGK